MSKEMVNERTIVFELYAVVHRLKQDHFTLFSLFSHSLSLRRDTERLLLSTGFVQS